MTALLERATAEPGPELSRAQRIWTTIVCCAGVALVMSTLVGLYPVAADIARDTGASQTEVTWIVDAYTLVMGGLLLPAGALSDRYGRRGVMLIGLGVFIVAAITGILADTPGQLIASRGFLGVGAALLLPSTLSLITSTFPKEHQGAAVAIWTTAFTSSAGIGATSYSAALEFFSWRAAMWIVLIGGVLVFVAAFGLPTSRDENPPPIDAWGAATGALSITAFVYGLIEAGMRGWSDPLIIGALSFGVLTAALFTLIQLRRRHPLLDVRLFTIRAFGSSAYVVAVCFATLYALFFLTLQYQQYVQGYSALAAALPPAFMSITIVPVTMASTWLTKRFGLGVVSAMGCLGEAGAFAVLLTTDPDSSYWTVVGLYLVMGMAVGMNMAPCTSAILETVPEEKQGVAAAVNHTTREVGTALGVALVGGVLSAGYLDRIRDDTDALPEPAREISRESIPGALAIAEQSGPAGAGLADSAREAFVGGMHDTGWVMIGLLIVSAVIVVFWGPGPDGRNGSTSPGPVTAKGRKGSTLSGMVLPGIVTTAAGAPVSDARITMTTLDGQQVGLARSDAGGAFELPVAEHQRYLVVCAADRMEPQAAFVHTTGGDGCTFRLAEVVR